MTTSRTSSRWPESSAVRTPGTDSSSRFMRLAVCRSVRSGTFPDNTIEITGFNAMLNSLIWGSSASWGNFGRAVSTFSWMRWRASSLSKFMSNSRLTAALPCEAADVICLRPSIVLSWVSSGRTMRRSASSGEMPGWTTTTVKNGNWMSGSASLGMLTNASVPIMRTAPRTQSVRRARWSVHSTRAIMVGRPCPQRS